MVFLERLNLSNLIDAFAKHQVAMVDLPDLTDENLINIGVTKFGDRKRIIDAVSSATSSPSKSNSSSSNDVDTNHGASSSVSSSARNSSSTKKVLPVSEVSNNSGKLKITSCQTQQWQGQCLWSRFDPWRLW